MKNDINKLIFFLSLILFLTPVFPVLAEEASLFVRMKYLNETGQKWHDASEKEQADFLKRIEVEENIKKREKLERAKEKTMIERKQRIEKRQEENLKRKKEYQERLKKRQKIMKERVEKRAIEQKRRKTQKDLVNMQREFDMLHRKSRQRR